MVVLSLTNLTSNRMSMVAWAAWWWVLLLSTFAHHAHGAGPNNKYVDVNGEELVIDQLQDYLRAHHQGLSGLHHLQAPPPPAVAAPHQPPRYHQKLHEKIQFAVTPDDPRYYLPPGSPSSRDTPTLQHHPPSSMQLRFLHPELSLQEEEEEQPEVEYPAGLLDYRGVEDLPRYQPSYPRPYQQQQPRYLYPHQEEGEDQGGRRYPAVPIPPRKYLPLQELQGGGLFSDPSFGGREEEDGGAVEELEDGREENKREMMLMEEEGDNMNQPMEEKSEDSDKTKKAAQKVATSQPEEMNYMHYNRAPAGEAQAANFIQQDLRAIDGATDQPAGLSDVYFTGLVAGCTALAVCGVIGAGICWYRLNKSHRATQDAEYPAYGVTGPNKELSPSGDRKLAQSAHMYHYQHQKQQMIALDKSSGGERHGSASDVDSEEEGEENEYTVYECPGLAPTGEMEVKNPLFHDDPTPATPSIRKEAEKEEEEEDGDEEEEEEEEINTK